MIPDPGPGTQAPDRARLRQLCLLTADLDRMLGELQAVFGTVPCHGTADLIAYGISPSARSAHSQAFFDAHGLVNALLPFGAGWLEVVMPIRADAAAARFMARRGGDLGYMVIAEVADIVSFECRARAAGLRIAGGADYPEYRDVQLDPRDVGGSLLAFAMQCRGQAFDGSWYPAGGRPSTACGKGAWSLAGCVVACSDPRAVAERWGKVFGRAAYPEVAPAWRLDLDGGYVRFVGDPERRGDRLEEVCLEGGDKRLAEEEARRLHLLSAEGAVLIGGVAFRLA
jgi:Glyoxalase-like domain